MSLTQLPSMVLVLAGALVVDAIAQSAPTATFRVPFAMPAKIGDVRLRDSSFIAEAMAYRYAGRRITGFDIYVWPLPAESLDAAARDTLLQIEVTKFKEAAPLGLERGWYDDYKIAFDAPHPIALDGDSLPGYVVALVFARRGQRFASFFYIYVVQGMYFKIRLTVPGDDWGSNPAMDLPATLVQRVTQKR
jgi:hypothetical protein